MKIPGEKIMPVKWPKEVVVRDPSGLLGEFVVRRAAMDFVEWSPSPLVVYVPEVEGDKP